VSGALPDLRIAWGSTGEARRRLELIEFMGQIFSRNVLLAHGLRPQQGMKKTRCAWAACEAARRLRACPTRRQIPKCLILRAFVAGFFKGLWEKHDWEGRTRTPALAHAVPSKSTFPFPPPGGIRGQREAGIECPPGQAAMVCPTKVNGIEPRRDHRVTTPPRPDSPDRWPGRCKLPRRRRS